MTQVVFISHGGGSLPLLGDPNHIELIQHLQQLSQNLEAPEQILVISDQCPLGSQCDPDYASLQSSTALRLQGTGFFVFYFNNLQP